MIYPTSVQAFHFFFLVSLISLFNEPSLFSTYFVLVLNNLYRLKCPVWLYINMSSRLYQSIIFAYFPHTQKYPVEELTSPNSLNMPRLCCHYRTAIFVYNKINISKFNNYYVLNHWKINKSKLHITHYCLKYTK